VVFFIIIFQLYIKTIITKEVEDELVLSNVNLISNNFSTIKYVVWVKIWKYRKIKLLWSMTMIILMDDRLNEGY